LAELLLAQAVPRCKPGVRQDLLETETFLGVFPGETLEEVLEVLAHLYDLEYVPEGFSVGPAKSLKEGVLLVGTPEGRRLHHH
jgi:hypothetical protein